MHHANAFAYYAALPALIMVNLWDVDFRSGAYLRSMGVSTLSLAAFLAILFIALSVLKMDRDMKATLFLTAATGNTLYMGTALVDIGFGKEYVPGAALVGSVYLIIPLVLSIVMIRYWHTKEHGVKEELLAFFKNPLVFSVVIGVLLSFVSAEYAIVSEH